MATTITGSVSKNAGPPSQKFPIKEKLSFPSGPTTPASNGSNALRGAIMRMKVNPSGGPTSNIEGVLTKAPKKK